VVFVAQKMEKQICWNNLLTVFQFGFLRYHSTGVMEVIEEIRLLCKLQNAQICSVVAGMITGSNSGGRAQFVRFCGRESSVAAMKSGVPQGSVLSTLMFMSYIDDVSRVIKYCRV
jgi:hypothetical protein